VTNSTTALGD